MKSQVLDMVKGALNRNSQRVQPSNQVLLRPVAFHSVAVSAHQLQVLDIVLATAAMWDDVIDFQDAAGELATTAVAPAFLLTEKDVLVLPVGHWRVNVGAPGDVGGGRTQPVVEQVAPRLL